MSQRGRDEGPLSSGDGDLPELPAEWGPIVIPDDARELAVEAEQVRAELLAERRLPGWRGRRRARFGRTARFRLLPNPLITLFLVLLVVTGYASLMVIAMPARPRIPQSSPIAAGQSKTGTVGGLLPDVSLKDATGHAVQVREVRPAVVLLEPAHCASCARVATSLISASRDTRIPVALVAETAKAPAMPPGADRSQIMALADPAGALGTPITPRSATGPTAVLVRSNGVIARIAPDLGDAGSLRSELAGLTIN
jgi:hypothetical protein